MGSGGVLPVSVFAALELTGTMAFAVSGAAVAVRAGMDWLGVVVLAVVTAVGGGSIRDVLAGQGPVRWITAPQPAAIALGTAIAVIVLAYRAPVARMDSWPVVVIADAAGLAAFTVTGTQFSLAAGFHAPAAVLLGVVTGTGGGVVRDLLAGQAPLIFSSEIYALAATCGAVCVVLLPRSGLGAGGGVARWLPVAFVFLLRLAAIRWNWSLPRFRPHDAGRGAPAGGRDGVG